MLTRSRAKQNGAMLATDPAWNDAYIQTKDEQIDAMLAADASQRGWDELGEENSDVSDQENSDEDAWDSDQQDSDDDDDDWLLDPKRPLAERWLAGGSLLQNVWWTAATLLLLPTAVYATLPRSSDQLWPLESERLTAMLVKVLLNVLTLSAVAIALYAASCSVEPLSWSNVLVWRQLEMETPAQCSTRLIDGARGVLQAVLDTFAVAKPDAPLRRLDEDVWTLVESLDAPVVRELAGLLVGALVTITCFHRAWAKLLVLATAGTYLAWNVATEMQLHQRAAVEIFSLDPTFAFVNESIFIAIDGQNLEQGASVAWAPYWGGIQQQDAQACPKRFPKQLSNGGVLVTFAQVNEYVPCYLSASDAATAVVVDGEIRPREAFQCFENIRLRVKDQKSVPGWSLNQPQQQEELLSTEKVEL